MTFCKAFHRLSFVLVIFTVAGFLLPQAVLGQAEKLGPVSYSAPKGWKKTLKENIVTFSEVDDAGGKFCIITLYGATHGTGQPQSDFTREWGNLVVKPWGAEVSPKTETETVDGWTVIAGGSSVDFQGIKSVAFLTVLSNSGRTVSILGIFNDESYLTQLVTFNSGLDIEKEAIAAAPPMREETRPAPAASSATMNVGSLVMEFERNEVRAYQVWVGKRVRINGVINSIDVKSDGRIAITFKSTLSAYGNGRCYFERSQSPRVAALSANQEATVEGIVRGWEGGYDNAKVFVLLENCLVP